MKNFSSPTVSSAHFPAGLWWCKSCQDVRLMSDTDQAPHYHLQNGNVAEELDNEREVFLRRHNGHALVRLKKNKDRYFADRPAWDPLRIAYEEMTDGREVFLLKSWRTDLDEPRQYTVLRGSLNIATTIQLADEPLREELTREFSATPQVVEAVVTTLQRLVTGLPLDELVPAYCSAEDPQVSFFYPNPQHIRLFVESCRKGGSTSDKEKLRHFFVQRQQDDALMLELRQHCKLRFLS
jgi:hypothetical protein